MMINTLVMSTGCDLKKCQTISWNIEMNHFIQSRWVMLLPPKQTALVYKAVIWDCGLCMCPIADLLSDVGSDLLMIKYM